MKLTTKEKKELLQYLKAELLKEQREDTVVFFETVGDIKMPEYAKRGDAGMDVCSTADVTILPGETKIIPTGIKMALPEGYELQIRPRSGISSRTQLRIANSPATIDSGYRDEIGVIVSNNSQKQYRIETRTDDTNREKSYLVEDDYDTYSIDTRGNKNGIYNIRKGDRIAQLVLAQYKVMKLVKVPSVSVIGYNRHGGFGSSDIEMLNK